MKSNKNEAELIKNFYKDGIKEIIDGIDDYEQLVYFYYLIKGKLEHN